MFLSQFPFQLYVEVIHQFILMVLARFKCAEVWQQQPFCGLFSSETRNECNRFCAAGIK